jgi:protein ImuB
MTVGGPPEAAGGAPPPVRALAVWCPQWPVVALGALPHERVAVMAANRVVALTPAAAASGVAIGQRRRQAQGRCPDLDLRPLDDRLLAVAFEPVVTAVSAFTPRFELGAPGDCVLAVRGPARYFGGEQRLAERVAADLDGVLAPLGWAGWGRVAVADGATTARLVARYLVTDPSVGPAASHPVVVPGGGGAAALADLPVAVLFDPALGFTGLDAGTDTDLPGLLARLGLARVGGFAALDPADVLARFGLGALAAHEVARGLDGRPAVPVEPAPELVVAVTLDPPAERSDAVAFAARPVAEEFLRRLGARGSTTSVVLVEFETEHGELSSRAWRYDASPAGLVDRVRWQLDGWLSGPVAARPTAPVTRLRLVPGEVLPATGRQLGFWGEETAADQRAARVVARLDGLLGPGAVTVPQWRGGRGPAEQVVRVPAGVGAAGLEVPAAGGDGGVRPWPGAVPPPAPARVHVPALPILVLDHDGVAVAVDGRTRLSGPPVQVVPPGATQPVPVVAWAGPWPVDERWWDPVAHRRRARLQVCPAVGPALLVACEGGRWWCEATYD